MKILFIYFLSYLSMNYSTAAEVKISQIKTGEALSLEFLMYKGGKIFKPCIANHTAFLIKHDADYILFDSGLGRHINDQFKQDMPWWGKMMFKYDKVNPAINQLQAHGIDVKDIYLSHSHWDHASGLSDFLTSTINLPKDELLEIQDPKNFSNSAAFLKSQFNFIHQKWNTYTFTNQKYMGFEKSYDIFGDQTAVIVALPGHTKGSVGLIITTNHKKYFFIGDLVWRKKALDTLSPKFAIASSIVDGNKKEVTATMKQVLAFSKTYPEVIIVPAHDEEVQSPLGYFPNWIE